MSKTADIDIIILEFIEHMRSTEMPDEVILESVRIRLEGKNET